MGEIMSKCKPTPRQEILSLEKYGVKLEDVSSISRDKDGVATSHRNVVITIPYESLRDVKEVQILFQDIVTISTEGDSGDEV